jgi:hypothetical protein
MVRRLIKKHAIPARKSKRGGKVNPPIFRKHVPQVFGEEEAKIFDIPKPPIGLAYQWVLAEHVRKYPGWVQVPFGRHVHEMPPDTNDDGAIVYLGNILVQREQSLVQAELVLSQQHALKNLKDHPAYPGKKEGGPFRILSESFMVSSHYERVTGPSIVVDVTIPLRMSTHLQDTASALGLTAQEYLQRSISLYVRGETGGLLLPIDGAMELHQIYLNDQMRNK